VMAAARPRTVGVPPPSRLREIARPMPFDA
jgi:hypothetical protein